MKKLFVAFALVSVLLFTACTTAPNVSESPAPTAPSPDIPSMDFDFTKSDLNGEYTETGAVYIVFSGDTAQITGKGAFASGSSVTIESNGTVLVEINMTSNIYGSGMGHGGFPIGPGRH